MLITAHRYLVAFAVLSLILACGRQVPETPKTGPVVVRIGLPTPITGGAAPYGDFIRKGAELAVNNLNARPDAREVRYELVVEDGQGDPKVIANATQKLIASDGVAVLMDGFLSNATLAEIPIAQQASIPVVVSLSAADKITDPPQPGVFRLAAPNSRLSRDLGRWVLAQPDIKRVAIIYEVTEWGNSFAQTVRDVLAPGSVEVVAYEGVVQHDTNLLAVATKLKRLAPDAVVLGLISDQALAFLQQAHEAGIESRWLNAISVSNPVFLENAGTLARGFVGVTHYVAGDASPAATGFDHAYLAAYGAQPTHYAAMSYDTVSVIAEAVRIAGPTPAEITQGLRSASLDGVCGHVSFDEAGQATLPLTVFTWDGARMQRVP